MRQINRNYCPVSDQMINLTHLKFSRNYLLSYYKSFFTELCVYSSDSFAIKVSWSCVCVCYVLFFSHSCECTLTVFVLYDGGDTSANQNHCDLNRIIVKTHNKTHG